MHKTSFTKAAGCARKIEKRRWSLSLLVVMGACICQLVMVFPYNAAAITTLDSLESESNIIEQNAPHFDIPESPEYITVNEFDNIAYVTSFGSRTLNIIDGDTLKVSAITVGQTLGTPFVAVDKDENIAYVTNSGSDTVSVIDGTDGNYRNIANVPVGKIPRSIAVDYLGNIAYVANSGSDTVSVIDGTDGNYRNIANVPVGKNPISIAVDLHSIAYVANYGSDTVSVIDGTDGNYRNIANVTVGKNPISIAVDMDDNVTYVANKFSNTVSVISGETGPKLFGLFLENYRNIANVTVGKNPSSIAVDESNDVAYVANMDSDSVSVLHETRNTANVTVGEGPISIAVDDGDNIAYVANSRSDTVSVINGTDRNYRNIANVTVGNLPKYVAVSEFDNIAYVANTFSRTVSVLTGASQQVQAGVSFDVNPFHAGRIECSNITVPTNQYFYVDFRTRCTAQANQGFQFSSWIENLGSNSSRTISASQGDWFTNSLDWLASTLSGGQKYTPETLSITKFGEFAANFEKLPPAIPPEYLATLFAVVASAFIGSWLTPSFIGWRKAKKQGKKLDDYNKDIKQLYEDDKLDKNDINSLDKLRDKIKDEYARGKINKEQFDKLVEDISIIYREIFKKEIDSFTNLSEKNKEKEVNEIKDNIEGAYTKGKISEEYYNLLNKKIESFVNPNENKTSANKLQSADETHTMKRSPI